MKKQYTCETCGTVFLRTRPFEKDDKIQCRTCNVRDYYREHPEKQEEKKRKRAKTNLERYGVENPSNLAEVKNKISKKLTALNNDPITKQQINEKRELSNVEKFGVIYPSLRKDILEEGLATQRAKLGYIGWENKEMQKQAEAKAHTEEAEAKRRATTKAIYGVEYASQNEAIKQKVKETYMSNTGYDHPQHNPEIIHSNKGYIFEDIHFDSSWELAYFIWLRDNHKEFIYHPDLYMDYIDEEGEQRTYQPDFLVEGTFYEIKGDQFFNDKMEPYNRYTKSFWWNKYNALIENNVVIIKIDEAKKYLKYIKDNYGKNYLKQFRTNRNK